MAVFVFNEGYGHRGVWHLAEGPIEYTTFPAERREFIYDVIDHHTKKCGLNKWDYQNRTERVCTCGHTGQPTGEKCKMTHIQPEYTSRSVPKVACHQVDKLRSGDGLKSDIDFRAVYGKPGDFVMTYTFKKGNYIFEGDDFPPGPVCSRCRNKLNA